jgi:hypothetical protein
MYDQKAAKRAWLDEASMTPFERKNIFDELYHGEPSFDVDNEIFKKQSEELDGTEMTLYWKYLNKLEAQESILLDRILNKTKRILYESEIAVIESRRLLAEFDLARTQFFIKYGKNIIDESFLIIVCNELGPLLFDIVNDKNSPDEKRNLEIIKIITECSGNDIENRECLLKSLNLYQNYSGKVRIPLDSKRIPITPSMMNGSIQNVAARNDVNFVYPYPFGIENHFPVFFCHSVFVDFADILNDRVTNNVVGKYKEFLNSEPDIKMKLDKCIAYLIGALLSFESGQKENSLVEGVVSALKILFPPTKVQSNIEITSVTEDIQSKFAMDAVVAIDKFPFILLEAKDSAYSLNAVLQGLQLFGLTSTAFIDNDPCFLITFDRGILFVYGVAKVNCRVVCSCLLSLEFTNYSFNVQKFTDTLFKCLGALRFFFDKFSARLPDKSSDLQHNKYSSIKSAPSYINKPFPAIFSVKKVNNSEERIEISFEDSIDSKSYLKPCVYLVKSQGRYAILKLASYYGVEVHKKLADENLAPRILGHEILCDSYQIILMEYLDLDSSVFDCVYNYLHNNYGPKINQERLLESIKGILSRLKELEIVHGDFRSNNIMAKRSADDPSVLEDFMLIDFEFSGKVDEPYPCLATKNPDIVGFNSYSLRKHEHDNYMFMQMIDNEFN